MLQAATCGFGWTAFSGLAQAGLMAKPADLKPRAKRVIFLFMSGGPAQLDTFDYKPQVGKKPHPGSVYKFARHGESGLMISELMPETARMADKLCVINGMHADTGIHAQSAMQLHTGDRLRERPSLGSWVSYGLGTENANLPGFISLNTSRPTSYSSAFLPSIHRGTPIGVNGENMSHATIADVTGDHLPVSAKRRQLDFLQTMNRRHLADRPGDAELDGVIKSMELGFQMQASAPGLLDLSDESPATLERYRVGKQEKRIGTCRMSDFGRQCLLARRFAEAGVRFIELNHGSWDQHKNHRRDLEANCQVTDAPVAALLEDLDQRGMLEETLVVVMGEFCRTPKINSAGGRDHWPNVFSVALAGGGVKGGQVIGSSDLLGEPPKDNPVTPADLAATIYTLLGIDPNRELHTADGRPVRVARDGARVIEGLIG